MFEQEKKELFELCLRVKEETNAYLFIDYSTDSYLSIGIQELGHDSSKDYDAWYPIFEDPNLEETAMKNYEDAKEHLTRLLEKGRCPL